MLPKRIDMNFSIQQRKQFRNPSIYEKLIDHLEIEEIGTNYPTVYPLSSFSNPKFKLLLMNCHFLNFNL